MSEVPVNLPVVSSKDDVLVVLPKKASETGIYGYGDRTEQILAGRDLSVFETREYSEPCYQSGKEGSACVAQRDAARRFVYEHWSGHRRGYIQIGMPCVDCGPVDHIFIEPDENGRWIIVITLETNSPLSTSRSVRAVFRRRHYDDWFDRSSPRLLSLTDENGKEVEAF